MLLSEAKRSEARGSGAPLLRKFSYLSIREILVVTSAYAYPYVQTLGEGKEVGKQPEWEVGTVEKRQRARAGHSSSQEEKHENFIAAVIK